MRTRRSTLTPLLSVLPLLVACGDTSGPDDGAADTMAELPRALTAVESELVSASNAFGFDLLREVLAREERPNVVLSPLSASIALGMTLNGADGDTYDAMQETLGYGGMEQGEINTAYQDLTRLLVELDPAVDFRVANSLWADEGFPFETSFVETVSEAFDASARTLDLQAPATLDEINGWVEEETNGYIPRLLDEIGSDLVMFLINAIYFESTWSTRFDEADTQPAPFRTAGGEAVQVQLMNMRDPDVAFGVGEGFTAVDLPYGGQAYGMLVLLPTEGASARELASGLTAADLASLEASMGERELSRLALPRFRLAYGTELNAALEAMGMGVAFDESAADFSRMSPEARLFIDQVRQKAFIEVDEAGTRAAAATSVGVGVTSLPPEFVVDRPFVFLLRERLSGTVLFAGVVGDPTAEE
jgi:serpin B